MLESVLEFGYILPVFVAGVRVGARRVRRPGSAGRGECSGGVTASGRWTRAVATACVRFVYTSLGARDVGCCAAEAAAARCDGHDDDDDDGSRNNSSDARSWFRGRNVSRKPCQAVGGQCWSLQAVGQARVACGYARRVRGEPGQVVCVWVLSDHNLGTV